MDPLNSESFNQSDVKLSNGKQYHVCDEKPENYVHGTTPVLLLVHGTFDFWYGWRYQIKPWVDRGWRVVTPDILGCGGTDKPKDVSLYTVISIAEDLALLLAALDIRQPVVVIGNEGGGYITWGFAKRYPEKTRAAVSLNAPYPVPVTKPTAMPPAIHTHANLFNAWTFFTSPEGCAQLQKNVAGFVDMLYRSDYTILDLLAGDNLQRIANGEALFQPSDILTAKERQIYIDNFERGGLEPPANQMRSKSHIYEQEQALKLDQALPKELPLLLLASDKSPFSTPERIETTNSYVPSLEVKRLDCGHWGQLEEPEEVAQIVGDWVAKKL